MEAAGMASKVMDLIYWRDMGWTGVVFTGVVLGLLCLFQISAITMVSTVSLSIMCFTLPVRLLYKAMELCHWGSGAHPFESYIEPDDNLTDELTILYVQQIVVTAASTATKIKQLFFVADLINSIKFVVLMYLLTYVGVLCNGLTLLIIGVISIFSLPLLYKQQQERIDKLVSAVTFPFKKISDQISKLIQRVKAIRRPTPAPTTTPGPKPKSKTK